MFTLRNLVTKPLAALLVGVLSVSLVSCEKSSSTSTETKIELTILTNPASKEAGNQYITVKTDGLWNLSIVYQGSESNWISLAETSGDGTTTGGSMVLMSYSANDSLNARSALIKAYNSKYSQEIYFTQKGTSTTSSGTSSGNSGVEKTSLGWLELPETKDDDGFDFFTHSTTLNNATVRNYSFYWDYDNYVAPWVAYPLTSEYMTKNVSRTDEWALDPLLARSDQPVLYSGFKEGSASWKARGHQIPSMDRLCSRAANVQTFYFTNMTPQDNTFNGTPWLALENKVQSWASNCDTLYVVTGCVTEGSTTYCLDNDGKHITVPTAYFKAVLRYQSGSSYGYRGYAGCCFYMEHSASLQASYIAKANSLSINDLEDKLGYKLFVNLSNVVGEDVAAQIKAQKPSTVAVWWQ